MFISSIYIYIYEFYEQQSVILYSMWCVMCLIDFTSISAYIEYTQYTCMYVYIYMHIITHIYILYIYIYI